MSLWRIFSLIIFTIVFLELNKNFWLQNKQSFFIVLIYDDNIFSPSQLMRFLINSLTKKKMNFQYLKTTSLIQKI